MTANNWKPKDFEIASDEPGSKLHTVIALGFALTVNQRTLLYMFLNRHAAAAPRVSVALKMDVDETIILYRIDSAFARAQQIEL